LYLGNWPTYRDTIKDFGQHNQPHCEHDSCQFGQPGEQRNLFILDFSDFFRCHNILQATDLIATVAGYGLGNATDPSVTVTVA
jgi:hypothetical protein